MSNHTLALPRYVGPSPAIRLGDAFEQMQSMRPNQVHSIVTDPPYGLDARGSMVGHVAPNYSARGAHTRGYAANDPVVYQEWCRQWASEALRVLRPGGHLITFGGTRTVHRLTVACEDVGFEVRGQNAWVHQPGAARGKRLTDHTGTHTGWTSTHNPAFEPIVLVRKPLSEKTLEANMTAWGTGALNTEQCRPQHASSRWRQPSVVLVDDAVALERWDEPFFIVKPSKAERNVTGEGSHPTAKPLALMRYLVRMVTPPGGHVLDPFAGSGTTIEAAMLEGCHATGIELDPLHLPRILARIQRARDAAA